MASAAYWVLYGPVGITYPKSYGQYVIFLPNVQKNFCIMQNVSPFIRRYLDQTRGHKMAIAKGGTL